MPSGTQTFFLHVYKWVCKCVYVCTCSHVCGCICVRISGHVWTPMCGDPNLMLDAFLDPSSLWLLRCHLPLNPGITYQSQLVWLVSLPWRYPSYTSLVFGLKMASKAIKIFVDAGCLISGPRACEASLSSTELYLQSQERLSSALFLFSHAQLPSCDQGSLAPCKRWSYLIYTLTTQGCYINGIILSTIFWLTVFTHCESFDIHPMN